jgi:hypothetical protein
MKRFRAVRIASLALTFLLAGLAGPAGAAGLGPLPYLCFDAATSTAVGDCGTAQSPFAGLAVLDYFHLENFEDDSFEPGWSIGGVQTRTGPSGITDSVDEDDGTIDGSGTGGSSHFEAAAFSVDFDAGALGALPTHVGFVWTDGGEAVTVTAEFFGPGHVSLGSIVAPGIGDASINGETDEDRFFGWIDSGGIESVSISHTGGGYEIDHLQYGRLAGALPSIDSFLCYKAKPTKGGPGFDRRDATIAPAAGVGGDFSVLRYAALCNPAHVGGGDILDEATHLASFAVKPVGKLGKTTGVHVSTPLGALSLDLLKPDRLLLPAAKSLEGPVDPLSPPGLDPFLCSKAKITRGTAKLPKGVQLDVGDQFAPGRTFDVKKPTHLCVTASVDGVKLTGAPVSLVCFKTKPARGQPKHQKRHGVFVNHAFGPGQLDTVKEDELCLPAQVQEPG